MRYSAQDIQERIRTMMPEGSVITEHTDRGHFYRIMTPDEKGNVGNVYPSVTGKLQILKDESLINYKKNQVITYIFKNFSKLTEANLMEHLSLAERVPEDILADASDIGRQIHDTREEIFKAWMASGVRPEDFTSFIKPDMVDVRLRSAIRALQSFCIDHDYRPIATELFVYNHKLKVAGTLDDIGFLRKVLIEGDPQCKHDYFHKGQSLICFNCDRKVRDIFVLMDLKSSNQFKDHYFFQVGLYYWMLFKLLGIRPEECFILKLSKEDGTYKIENLKKPAMLASYARSMLRTNDAIAYIRSLRKDNQKNVAEKISF